MSDFHRVRRLPPYVFEQVNKLKAKARAAGADIVDLGMGNPDLPAPQHVLDKLVETVGKPRTDRYSASKGIPGLRRAQAGLLRPPLRREAQSRDAGRRHAGLEGGLRQHGAGDHRAGRRGAGAQSLLSDPRLRLSDGGRRDPLGAGRADARFLRRDGARAHPFDPQADRGGRLLSLQSDRDGRLARFLQGPRRSSPRSTRFSFSPTSPTPKSISTTSRRPRCCRRRAPSTSRSSSRRCRRPFRWRAGASALRSATNGCSRRWRG